MVRVNDRYEVSPMTDLVQGNVRAVPGGEARFPMSAVADITFLATALPLQVMGISVNTGNSEPGERLLIVHVLHQNYTVFIRRACTRQEMHSLKAWMYRDHCLSFFLRSTMLSRGEMREPPGGGGEGSSAPMTLILTSVGIVSAREMSRGGVS